jgi:hypothetical protein
MKRSILLIAVLVLVVLVAAGGYVGVTQLGLNKPEATPPPPPAPIQEQNRAHAIRAITTDIPPTPPLTTNLTWTGGLKETGLVGSETYLYNSTNGWVMEITNPVDPNPVYTISANYSAGDISVEWAGTCQDGNVTATYYITYGLEYQLSPQEEVRDAVYAYIKANHTDAAPYMVRWSWSGGRITPEGLVGYETYQYTGLGWNITIGNVVYYDITYDITALYIKNAAVYINWTGTVHNGVVTETNYTANLPPIQELVRDNVMSYIKNHHEDAAAFLPISSWTGGHVDQGMMVGSNKYSYAGGNWNVTIRNPVIPNPTYTVTATYTGDGTTIAWEGTWKNGDVAETSYTSPSYSAVLGSANLPLTS